jgi:hypothetical protein
LETPKTAKSEIPSFAPFEPGQAQFRQYDYFSTLIHYAYKWQLAAEGADTYRDSANPDATATIIVKQSARVVTESKMYLPLIMK